MWRSSAATSSPPPRASFCAARAARGSSTSRTGRSSGAPTRCTWTCAARMGRGRRVPPRAGRAAVRELGIRLRAGAGPGRRGAVRAGRGRYRTGRERAARLAAYTRDRLREHEGLRVLDRGPRLCAIVTVEVAGRSAFDLVPRLREQGINTSATAREYAVLDMDEKGARTALRILAALLQHGGGSRRGGGRDRGTGRARGVVRIGCRREAPARAARRWPGVGRAGRRGSRASPGGAWPDPPPRSGVRNQFRTRTSSSKATTRVKDRIIIRNARQHNLKGIDLDLPRRARWSC